VSLVTRGVLDETADAHLLSAARNEVLAAVEELVEQGGGGILRSDAELGETARLAVRRSLGKVLGFKPVTTFTVVRVGR
jgi:hypothetical protein